MSFQDRIRKFMYGRNGADTLYYASLIIYTALIIINAFVGSKVFSIINWVIFVLIFYRFFSKQLSKRYEENQKFTELLERIKAWFNSEKYKSDEKKEKREAKKRRANDKEHVYETCPNCEAIIRLPKVKGEHDVKCPRCSAVFKIRVK